MIKQLLITIVLASSLLTIAEALNDPNCGTKGPAYDTKIVGGSNTLPLEFPWQGSLRYFSSSAGWYHTCGCTLINKRWVLTAAHCVNRSNIVDPTMYKFVGGEHDRSKDEGTEVEVLLEKIIVHPEWNADKIDGDCALLKLNRDLDLEGAENKLGTACLPEEEDVEASTGKVCYATGWGNTAWQGTSPDILQKVAVNIISQKKCQSTYSWVTTITKYMLCFGENKKGTCQGDSGGPLNCKNEQDGKWYNYGATSFGVQCAGPTYPSVTSRISSFSKWIWNTIDNDQ